MKQQNNSGVFGREVNSLWTLRWIAEILVLLHYTLWTSLLCFRLRMLPLWWYLVPRPVMEVSLIHILLRLIWKSVQRSNWTSWRHPYYRGWSRTLGLIMWCWSRIQHQVIPQRQHRHFLVRRYHYILGRTSSQVINLISTYQITFVGRASNKGPVLHNTQASRIWRRA